MSYYSTIYQDEIIGQNAKKWIVIILSELKKWDTVLNDLAHMWNKNYKTMGTGKRHKN